MCGKLQFLIDMQAYDQFLLEELEFEVAGSDFQSIKEKVKSDNYNCFHYALDITFRSE